MSDRQRTRAAVPGQRDRRRGGCGDHEHPGGEDGAAMAQERGHDARAADSRRGEPERRFRGVDQLGAASVAFVAVLGEPLRQHRVQRGLVAQRRELLLHVRPQRLRLRLAVERRHAGQAFVEHAGERVAVGPRVDRLATDLLWREVVERADHLPGVGGVAAELLGHAEVRQVDVPVRVDEHVARLDVAVDEAAPMGRIQRLRDPAEDRERVLGSEHAFAPKDRLEVAPFDVAHGQVQLPALLARLVDRHDVRVVERRGQPRLLEEAPAESLVLGQLGRDQFQGDGPLKRQVSRAIDDAHPAAGDQRLDSVTGEDGAGRERGRHCPLSVSDQLKWVRVVVGREPSRGRPSSHQHDHVPSRAREQRLGHDSRPALDDQRRVGEQPAGVTAVGSLVGGGADQAQRRAGGARDQGAELERRPVMRRGAEGHDDRPGPERAARLHQGVQRLGLATRAKQGDHQLTAQPLSQRLVGDERLQRTDELRVPTSREIRVDPRLESHELQLLQTRDLALDTAFVREVGERRPAPEPERLAQLLAGGPARAELLAQP